ncbi:MAG: bifunctional nuclease family protein [Nitrospirota bacterium]
MLVSVKVQGLVFDPHQNTYIVVLREEETNDVLPIWIGRPEANAIGLAVEGVFYQRPLTHDLISNVVDKIGAKIISVVLTDLRDTTYYSKIHLWYNDLEVTIDSRPSDAIALALRADAPIFINDRLIKRQSSEEITRWLEGLNPEDFGKHEV